MTFAIDETSSLSAHVRPLQPLSQPYLLVTGIPCWIDMQARRWTDPLWYKDLRQHVRYLHSLVIACPAIRAEPPAGAVSLSDDAVLGAVQYIDLPYSQSLLQGIWHLPRKLVRLWATIGQVCVVHAGVADWPIPSGWIASPLARWHRKFLVINIESAFWRVPPAEDVTLRRILRSWLTERLNRWCVNHADLPLFTHEAYRQQLLTRNRTRGHVIHASWIDEENIITDADAAIAWQQKQHDRDLPARMLFAGRLTAAKGVSILLDAVRRLDAAGVPLHLDLLGDGELASQARSLANELSGHTRLRLLGVIPYGAPFFKAVRRYEAVVVPSISDEQPRIIYDAFSQAVPILGTATPGIRECVVDGRTGRLVPSNDVASLFNLLRWSCDNRDELRRMGMAGLRVARSLTHWTMHERRWRLLQDALEK